MCLEKWAMQKGLKWTEGTGKNKQDHHAANIAYLSGR